MGDGRLAVGSVVMVGIAVHARNQFRWPRGLRAIAVSLVCVAVTAGVQREDVMLPVDGIAVGVVVSGPLYTWAGGMPPQAGGASGADR